MIYRGPGWKRDTRDDRDKAYAAPARRGLLRRAMIHWPVPIFDQGSRGSCTANMYCAMHAHVMCLMTRVIKEFSRLYMYDRTRQIEGTPLTADDGAMIRSTFKASRKWGVPEEYVWPYEKPLDQEPDEAADLLAEKNQAIVYYKCNTLESIKSSLQDGFAVGFGFDVFNALDDDEIYRTGDFPMIKDKRFDSGHAVLAIGHDDDAKIGDDIGDFEIINSWGLGFGRLGHGRIAQRYFSDGYAADAWTMRMVEVPA